jgi:hypothetical protein
VLFRRLPQPAVRLQLGSQIASAKLTARVDAGRGVEARMRFFLFAFQNQRATQVVLRNEIVLGDRQGKRPQMVIALPISDLVMCDHRPGDQNCRSRNRRPTAEFLLFLPNRQDRTQS